MPSNPSLSWQKLQNVYYSINTCYDAVKWPVDNLYAQCKVEFSPQTTLMALASKAGQYMNVIEVYTLTGNRLMSTLFHLTPQNHVADFCFHNEDLCLVFSDQRFRIYTDFEDTFYEYSYTENLVNLYRDMGDDEVAEENKYVITNLENNQTEDPFHVVEANCWGNFLVLRFRNKIIFTDLTTFTNYEASLAHLNPADIHCMSLLSCEDNSIQCLLSYKSTVFKISVDTDKVAFEMEDQALTAGPFSMMSSSPNGTVVALLSPTSRTISVINKNFDKLLLEYDTSNESSLPYMMEWSGNDAIVLSLRDEIKLIGPSQSISFFYDIEQDNFDLDVLLSDTAGGMAITVPIIKTQEDSLRIITKNKVELLRRVPESSINLHSVGSSHPSPILLDCVDKLATQSSKADSNISLLKSDNSLTAAISGCLEAALDEISPAWQKKILKAASFGKIYDNNYDADEYLKTVNTLKVLNQLRTPEVGIFLTHEAVTDLGWTAIIEMLLRRSQFLIALKIVDLLELEDCRSLVYVRWCCMKIRKEPGKSDLELFKIITKKLLSARGSDNVNAKYRVNSIDITEIFNTAHQDGRLDLYKLLISLEPSMLKVMRQLLRNKEIELALLKCFQTSDYDLCKLILLHFQDLLTQSEFFTLLGQNELKGIIKESSISDIMKDEQLKPFFRENLFINGDLIGNFWARSIGIYQPNLLSAYYKLENKGTERALLQLKNMPEKIPEASATTDGQDDFEKQYQYSRERLLGLSRNPAFKSMVQLEQKVLDLKRTLSNTFQQSFFQETSLVAILQKLIQMNQLKLVTKIAYEFKVSDAKVWNLVLDTYCKSKNFDRLYKFITASNPTTVSVWKSPIGFEVIAKSCMMYQGPRDQISTYISHAEVPYIRKIQLYVENNDLILAAEEALHNKDAGALQQLQKKVSANDENLLNTIKNYLSRLGY